MNSTRLAVWLSLVILAFALLACGIGPQATSVPTAPQSKSVLPTTQPNLTAQPKSAATPAAQSAATSVAAATPIAPALDPKRIVIAEEDIMRALAGGAGQEQGLKVQGLKVRFADEKMSLTADEFSMGPLQVRNLAMVGRLSALDGQLQFDSESMSPGGLVTAMLPAVANQVLAQFAANWYIEEVRVRDGRLELRIR